MRWKQSIRICAMIGVGEMNEQLSIFDYMQSIQPKEPKNHLLSVGDKIGRVVLGECRIATITEVEGLPDYPFYRTDKHGCYSYKEGLEDVSKLIKTAEENRKNYKTIVPCDLSERLTVEYAPRECDGVILWAQIGIIDNMLFWKEDATYQFLEPYESEKKLMKEYNKHKKNILEDFGGRMKYRIVEQERPMRQLYWSKHGFYADAEYVETNG